MRKKLLSLASVIFLVAANVMIPNSSVEAATVEVDGNPVEWSNVIMRESNDANVEKWAAMQDSDYIYFYVQQNGGDEWNKPISNTSITISYSNVTDDKRSKIQFISNFGGIKDGWYADIEGEKHATLPSGEADKYEAEFAIPKSFFAEEDFTIDYCGTSLKSSDIQNTKDVEEATTQAPVYKGITIDGNFSDWDAVSKVDADNGALLQTAVVFDGDYLYIYIKEKSDGVVTWSGECANGSFSILTDTGRDTVFKLTTDSVEGIEGATVRHSNLQYEIAIPESAIKQYKETISFGYYMIDEKLITDIVNINPDKEDNKEFDGIVYDGMYGDWDYYPHQLIQYSTPGGKGGDAEGALYVDGDTLFGHVKETVNYDVNPFNPFYIRINEDEDKTIGFMPVTVNENGDISKTPELNNLEPGTYEFYLWDLKSSIDVTNISDENAPIYGKMHVTVKEGGSEMEYTIDLEKLAQHFDMDANDMKMIQANYIVIGSEWISIAGTSTAPVMGIVVCGIPVLAALWYRKKKARVA